MTFSQDPTAVLDYTIDWSAWLPSGDTISESTWTVENLTPPMQLTLAGTANTGGELPAGTRYWVVTAVDANGETTASNEVSATFAQANGVADLSWPTVPNATGVKVYYGTQEGGESTLLATLPGTAASYTDDGRTAGTAGTPPTVNTAAVGVTIAVTPAPTSTPTTATAFIQGGTIGLVYTVGNHITTVGGRKTSRYLTISINTQYLS